MNSYSSLGHNEAQLAIETIKAELIRRGKAATIVAADIHGELVGLLRLDGASFSTTVIASNKAWTAARERTATGNIGRAARDPQGGFDIAYYGDPRYIGWGGGVPVVLDGAVVGSISVSGLSEAEDAELAERGVAAIAAAVTARQ